MTSAEYKAKRVKESYNTYLQKRRELESKGYKLDGKLTPDEYRRAFQILKIKHEKNIAASVAKGDLNLTYSQAKKIIDIAGAQGYINIKGKNAAIRDLLKSGTLNIEPVKYVYTTQKQTYTRKGREITRVQKIRHKVDVTSEAQNLYLTIKNQKGAAAADEAFGY